MYIQTFVIGNLLFQCVCSAYLIPFEIGNMISRRQLIIGAANICLMPKPAVSDESNRPLTSEEMEEYKKLLQEADRIKNIIKVNKEAFEHDFDSFNKTK
jgi:hypothetical protein